MPSSFIHLHLHSEYSLVDGIIRTDDLVARVKALGMPAVAITDQSNLFAMIKFYRAAEAAGVKPIIGVEVWLRHALENELPYRLLLLCQDLIGYRNLTELISQSYIHGQHRGLPLINREWLRVHNQGLIAIANALQSDIARALITKNEAVAKQALEFWNSVFPKRFYLELTRTGKPDEEDYVHAAVGFAVTNAVPLVASNDVRFLSADEFEAHEVRVCIHEGRTLDDTRRPRHYSEQQYLRSSEEMQRLFADIPQALENSIEIAKRCNLKLDLGKNYLPKFPVPDDISEAEYLRRQSQQGLHKRIQLAVRDPSSPIHTRELEYHARLKLELDVITQMGFSGYFLIVADFIRWAKEQKIPVGPGRGSGAGSIVAWALEITDLDPIRYDLLFERFLNPERVSMPDFDIDFCMDRRDEVIEYVANRFGRERVAQIITYGSLAAKAVVRDVGRVQGQPYGFVDRIAKLIPFEIGITLDKALEQEPQLKNLYDSDTDVQTLIDMAKILEGLVRNAGKHAGGVVIASSKLTDFTPLYCEEGSTQPVTQFDKDDVEAIGLVKFDFLGLRTLTIIDWTVQSINQSQPQPLLDISMIPVDDSAVFDLLKRCATTAVFQLESRGMKDLIKRLQPDSFDEIIALVALFRPGPLQSGMVDDFIDRKHGRAPVLYSHPALEPILKSTYGVILYQEQVMQIAQVLSGYTLGGADLLRRAMGKKKPEEMALQRSVFTDGAKQNNVDANTATSIFDLMEKFAGYGFNKSHSAAYALVAYQTAWLKAHYPADFMAAVLSADMDHTDKIVNFIEECRNMRLRILGPDINHSAYRFTVSDQGASIRYGLGAIKGVGQGAIELTLSEREAHGPFVGFLDFCRRVDARKINRRVMEALIRAGALDGLGLSRASLMGNLTTALKAAEQARHTQNLGIVDLFSTNSASAAAAQLVLRDFAEWDDATLLLGEKETLGLYLSGHPIEQYERELAHISSGRIAELVGASGVDNNTEMTVFNAAKSERKVVVAGLLIGTRFINTRRGQMAILTLDDRTARIDATLFSELLEANRHQLVKDKILVIEGKLGPDSFTGGLRLTAEKVHTIGQARVHFGSKLVIALDSRSGDESPQLIQKLAAVLSPFKSSDCPVWVSYHGADANAQLPLGKEWRVTPSDELIEQLKQVAGKEAVWMEYARATSAAPKNSNNPVLN